MKRIILIGNTVAADIMYAYLAQDLRYEVVGFSVDKAFIVETSKHGHPVVDLENLAQVYDPLSHRVIMASGYSNQNTTRQTLFEKVKEMGFSVESYIHPDARIYNSSDVSNIGEGSIIMPNTTIEVFTQIGKNSVVWTNCTIGHHSSVGDHCWIASGSALAGATHIGNSSFLGINATISYQVKIGERNIVGSGVAIHKDTKDNEVYLSRQGEKHRFSANDYAQYFLK